MRAFIANLLALNRRLSVPGDIKLDRPCAAKFGRYARAAGSHRRWNRTDRRRN